MVNKVRALADERKALAAEVAVLKRQLAMGAGGGDDAPKEINGIKLIARRVDGVSGRIPAPLVSEAAPWLGGRGCPGRGGWQGHGGGRRHARSDRSRHRRQALVQAATAALGEQGRRQPSQPRTGRRAQPGCGMTAAITAIETLIGAK